MWSGLRCAGRISGEDLFKRVTAEGVFHGTRFLFGDSLVNTDRQEKALEIVMLGICRVGNCEAFVREMKHFVLVHSDQSQLGELAELYADRRPGNPKPGGDIRRASQEAISVERQKPFF